MPFSHVFCRLRLQGLPPIWSPVLKSLRAQTEPSKIILCTSTPSPFLEKMGERYGIPLYVREGESNIKDDWNFAWEMAEGDFVTLAHQDDLYHKNYTKELRAAVERFPDLTVFTSDYVIIKGKKLIEADRMLWVKRFLRLPLRIPALGHLSWVKDPSPDVWKSHLLPGHHLLQKAAGGASHPLGLPVCLRLGEYAAAGQKARAAGSVWSGHFYTTGFTTGAATKACMRDHRREREEQEMFERFWPRPLVELLMKGYRTAYKEYD